jgi:hypothetical protein
MVINFYRITTYHSRWIDWEENEWNYASTKSYSWSWTGSSSKNWMSSRDRSKSWVGNYDISPLSFRN